MTDWTDPIRERLKAATPGPWFNGIGEGEAGLSRVDNGTSEMFPFYPENHDAELIANSPTDIANLLEEREVLREALREAVEQNQSNGIEIPDLWTKALNWKPKGAGE